MDRTLPNSTSILASGKAATLAVTALAADRTTVLVARSFGTLTEIGTIAVYWGPPLVVDSAQEGFLQYDIDGDADTAGTVVDLQPFLSLDVNVVAYLGVAAVAPSADPIDVNVVQYLGVAAVAPSTGPISATVAGYATGQSPADHVLVTPDRPIAADASGRVDINLAQVGLTPRPLDAVADSALTTGDALVAAISGAAGKESVVGTAYTIKTPSTGTAIRTFALALDGDGNPTARS